MNALIQKQQIGPRNRLVISIRLAQGKRVTAQGLGKSSKGIRNGEASQVQPRRTEVVGMMKLVFRERTVLQLSNEILIQDGGI
ncbi:MAG: hypothetical protein WA324_13375 [Bryobacteraceae bacterium]